MVTQCFLKLKIFNNLGCPAITYPRFQGGQVLADRPAIALRLRAKALAKTDRLQCKREFMLLQAHTFPLLIQSL